MHRTKALGGDVDMMPKASLTTRQRDGADLAAPVTTPVHVENALDANAPVPASSLKVPHQLRIGKAPIRQKNNSAVKRQQCSHLIQQVSIDFIPDATTPMLQDLPNDGDGSASVDHRDTHDAILAPQRRGKPAEK